MGEVAKSQGWTADGTEEIATEKKTAHNGQAVRYGLKFKGGLRFASSDYNAEQFFKVGPRGNALLFYLGTYFARPAFLGCCRDAPPFVKPAAVIGTGLPVPL